MDLADIVRRHWRALLPSWLAPAPMMIALLMNDVFGWSMFELSWGPPVILLMFLALGMSGLMLKLRRSISTTAFYVVWLVPTLVLWSAFVLTRGVILTLLGRPL